MILTSLIFMLSSAWCYALLTKRRFENFVFPALAADVIVLYFFAIFNGLKAGFLTVIALKVLLLVGTVVWFSFHRKGLFNNFKDQCCTPGLVFLTIGVPLSFYLTMGEVFHNYDEFSWWGTSLKNTYMNDALPLISRNMYSGFLNYPPAMQLWNYLFLKIFHAGFNENLCYCATNLLTIAVFTTYYGVSRWKDVFFNIFLGIALFILPFYFLPDFYNSLYVDIILGLVFGTTCVLQIKHKYELLDALILLFVCSFLLLIKRSAASLVAFSLIFACGCVLKNLINMLITNGQRISCLKNICLYLIPMFSYLISISWNWTFEHYKVVSRGAFEINNITWQKVSDALCYNYPDKAETILNAFLDALFVKPTYQFATFKITAFGLVIIILVVLLLGAAFIKNKNQKNKINSLAVILFVCFFIYAVSLMVLYIFTFGPHDGPRLASFNRYLNTFIVGIGIFMIGVMTYCDNKKISNVILSFFLFLVPDLWLHHKQSNVNKRLANEIMNQTLKSIEKHSKVLGLYQGGTGFQKWVFLFDHNDRYSRICSIGKTEDKNDNWRLNYTKEKLIGTLKYFNYCYIMHKDDILLNQYGDLFKDIDSVKDNRLFKLEKNQLVQVPIKKFIFDFEKVAFLREDKAKSKKAKTYYDRINVGQRIKMLPQGTVTFSTYQFHFNQSVKSIAVKCEFISGNADLTLMYGNVILAKFGAEDLRKGSVTCNCNRRIDMDKLRFAFINNSNANTNMLVKNIEFTFDNQFFDDNVIISNHGNKTFAVDDFGDSVNLISNNIIAQGNHTFLSTIHYYKVDNGHPIKYSARIKNTGKVLTKVYTGFAAYNDKEQLLMSNNYSYNKQKNPVKVINAKAGESKITVQGKINIAKGLQVALDAAVDNSDIPNTNLLPNKIISAQLLSDGNTVIALNSPLKTSIKSGSLIRICGLGGGYIYCETKLLKPSEEHIFTGAIHKDDTCIEYTSKALSQGTAFVKPIILSYSHNSKAENTIQITDYKFEY